MSNNDLDFVLPSCIATRRDVMGLLRELERIDAALTESEARQKVGASVNDGPAFSDKLVDFLNENHVTLSDTQARHQLIQRLQRFKDTMPLVHMTFATEADPQSIEQLVAWMRQAVHPQAVLTIGLQPELIGGVHIRTTNHIHDLSVRARLGDARYLIAEELEAIHAGR